MLKRIRLFTIQQLREFFKFSGRCSRQILHISLVVLIVAFFLGSYYCYLSSLYLVDEHYEAERLRELNLDEKFTIRVVAPADRNALDDFVLNYSICPYVHEIQIIWPLKHDPPKASDFKYTTTHSKVTFFRIDYSSQEAIYSSYFDAANIATTAVLTLDADVLVRCPDLAFTHSVWKSTKTSLVGFFPRLIRKEKGGAWVYNSVYSVVYSSAYNFMLYAGVMFQTEYLKGLHSSRTMRDLLAIYPQCADYLLPLWARSQGALSPVWAQTSYVIKRGVPLFDYPSCSSKQKKVSRQLAAKESDVSTNNTKASILSEINKSPLCRSSSNKPDLADSQRSKCINVIATALNLVELSTFTGISKPAKNAIFW